MKIIKHGILPSIESNRRSCWPTVCRLADGRLAAVWSGGRVSHVDPFGRVDICYSDDEGETWSVPKTILDTPLDDRDAGITNWNGKTVVTTFNNTILMQMRTLIEWGWTLSEEDRKLTGDYLVKFPMREENKYLGSLIAFSEDGEIFDTYQKLPITAPHGPISLKNGTLMYVGGAFQSNNDDSDSSELPVGIYIMTTKDGANWMGLVPLPKVDYAALYEPHAVECEDGKIVIFARAEGYDGSPMTMIYTHTYDGKTFEPWKNLGVKGQVGPTHAIKLKDGRILVSFGRRDNPLGASAIISADNGNTWSEEMVIRGDGLNWDLGYPSSVELLNGNILTVYYFRAPDADIIRIYYTIWSIDG